MRRSRFIHQWSNPSIFQWLTELFTGYSWKEWILQPQLLVVAFILSLFQMQKLEIRKTAVEWYVLSKNFNNTFIIIFHHSYYVDMFNKVSELEKRQDKYSSFETSLECTYPPNTQVWWWSQFSSKKDLVSHVKIPCNRHILGSIPWSFSTYICMLSS